MHAPALNLDFDAIGLLRDVARAAGSLALGWFVPGGPTTARIWSKEGGSPVTEADVAVDAFIKVRLAQLGGDIGWLSEETVDDHSRMARRLVWVIDPIDGTRAYMQGDPNWTIALALVADGRPIAGVVFAPVSDALYEATSGGPALKNGADIRASRKLAPDGARVAGPRFMLDQAEAALGAIDRAPPVPSLAFRIAQVADGRLDAALISENAHDWDIAAAQVILESAGGVIGAGEAAPRYNRPVTRHPRLVAAGAALHAPFCSALGLHQG